MLIKDFISLGVLDEKIKTQTGIVEQIKKLHEAEAKKLDDLIKQKMELENENKNRQIQC